MLTALKGGPLWAAVIIVMGVVGACTALAYNGTLSGELWTAIITPIIVSVTGVTAAHVSGTQVAAALNTPPPGTSTVVPPTASPAAALPADPVNVPAAQPAMPT